MAVMIEGMEMPESCRFCTRQPVCSAYLNQHIKDPSSLYSYGQHERPNDCPLVEIITCKDCLEWGISKEYPDVDGGSYCSVHRTYTGCDYYCANAERR